MTARNTRTPELKTPSETLVLPQFLPDATRAVVKSLGAADLTTCGITCLMVNILHLSNHPGVSVIKDLGGIHAFMAWPGAVFSDSGGFQVFSLIQDGKKSGSVSERGFMYCLEKGEKKRSLTPEQSIQKQFQLGADVMFCLDYCTHPEADTGRQQESVRLTIAWAKRCKQEFERQVELRKRPGHRPLLFAVIQGGNLPELRRQCTGALLEIGFDGYGFGGWPVDGRGHLVEAVAQVADLVPAGFPLHGLGIGKPENLVQAFDMGYNLFDCVLPTRDARHKRLYIFGSRPGPQDLRLEGFYSYLYIQDERYVRDLRPLDEFCDCLCCRSYSRAYLHHLFKIDDPLLNRLASLHNLRFYTRLLDLLRAHPAGA